MKFSKYVFGSFIVVLTNKFARLCLNIFRDTVIQNFKSLKHEKVVSFQCTDRGNLQIYSSYSLPDLNMTQSFIKCSRSEALNTLLIQLFQTVTKETMSVARILTSVLQCISKFYDCTKFFGHQMSGEKVTNNKSYQIVCFRLP